MPLVFVWALGFATATTASDTQNLGLTNRTIQVLGVDVGLRFFYPTSEASRETSFGPWTLNAAKNAEISSGPKPLVVISHGLGGTSWNHHLLARALVEQGFVVLALQHPDDLKRVGSQAILDLRPREIRAAIDCALTDPDFAGAIDPDRIGMFGFSQGGLTTLRVLGAEASHDALIAHCQTNSAEDDEFCTGRSAGLFARLAFLWNKIGYDAPAYDPGEDMWDDRVKAAVVIAPVGAPVTDVRRVQVPLWIIRFGADAVVTFPFHAEALHSALPGEHRYSVREGIEHYAALSPFPPSIASEVGLPAQDPEGFDRAAFLQDLNRDIVQFFQERFALPE